jgi:hypothetical protein
MEMKWDTGIPVDLKRLFVSGTYICAAGHEGVKVNFICIVFQDTAPVRPVQTITLLIKMHICFFLFTNAGWVLKRPRYRVERSAVRQNRQ